jgi:hypothetical protein
LTITSGSSAIVARPIISVFSDMPGPLVAVIAFLPAKEAPTAAPMPGDLVLGLEHGAAVLPDLAGEKLHDLRRRRDRIAPEEAAAREDAAAAHMSLPSVSSFCPGGSRRRDPHVVA